MPDPDFDLGQFRFDAAALCRLLLRARRLQQPDFMAGELARRWDVEVPEPPNITCEHLLRQAAVQHDKLWRVHIGPHGSGGVELDDPHGDLKLKIAYFADDIGAAIESARAGKKINWRSVANWQDLPAIRDGLDRLPEPGTPVAPPPAGTEDGPFPPSGFCWGGREFHGLRHKCWRLVNHLWKRRNRTAEIATLGIPVNDEDERIPDDNQLGSLRRDANKFFELNEIPFRIKKSGQFVSLCSSDSTPGEA